MLSVLEYDVNYHLSISNLFFCVDYMLSKPQHVSVKNNMVHHLKMVLYDSNMSGF
jgi:hypothetical protein